MKHIKNLLEYEIRKTLGKLEIRDIGYVESYYAGSFYYRIDGRKFEISIKEIIEEREKANE